MQRRNVNRGASTSASDQSIIYVTLLARSLHVHNVSLFDQHVPTGPPRVSPLRASLSVSACSTPGADAFIFRVSASALDVRLPRLPLRPPSAVTFVY